MTSEPEVPSLAAEDQMTDETRTVWAPEVPEPASAIEERTPTVLTQVASKKTKEIGGTEYIAFNRMLAKQAIASHSTVGRGQDNDAAIDAVLAGMIAFAPRDSLEGMIAAQMLGLHNAAMECLARGAFAGQTFAGREMNLNQAAKLSRTYSLLMDTLGRHRGGGTQKIIVERVTVNAGGQAIVGAVGPTRGGVPEKREEQPRAKQLAYAPLTALLGLDPPREPVPVARDAEWTVPHARRMRDRRSEG